MKVIYIGRFSIPGKDAASTRVYNLGYAIKRGGHQVDYLCIEGFSKTSDSIEGSKYHSVFNSAPSKLMMVSEWFCGRKTFDILKQLHSNNHYDLIILYNVTSIIARKVLSYGKKEGIKIINDVTEWYEVSYRKGLIASFYALLIDRRIKKVDPKSDGIIAISSYLSEYYRSIDVNVIRIPPIFHYERAYKNPCNETTTVAYAGNPGTKDELSIIIKAVEEINIEAIRLKMVFIGTDRPHNYIELEKKGVFFKSKCDNAKAISFIQECDFTILLRRNERFAKAGYSTKVSESLYNGVPVICNEVGGADLDIEDGISGIKILDISSENVYNVLKRVAALTTEDLRALRIGSQIAGEKLYKVENYVDRINCFLDSIVK